MLLQLLFLPAVLLQAPVLKVLLVNPLAAAVLQVAVRFPLHLLHHALRAFLLVAHQASALVVQA